MTQLLPHDPLLSAKESQGPYNGPLSTYREWHSLLIGATIGGLVGWSATLRHDLRREPHYALAGALVGRVVAFALQR